MDPGANAARYNLRIGKCRPHRRKGRPLLGCALLPKLRHSWPDHAKTDCRIDRRYLRLKEVLCAVFHPRQRNSDKKTVLANLARTSAAVNSSIQNYDNSAILVFTRPISWG